MSAPRLVLASASPRRASLLRDAGLSFEVRPADTDESWIEGETPVKYAERVARGKLEATPREEGEIRLSADTTVWLESRDRPFGKARSREEGREMLQTLSAAGEHRVTTAFAWDGPDGPTVSSVTTTVHMRTISDEELELYLDGGDWTDKAGAYGIQARAVAFIPRIEGSYTNVVGLPVYEVLDLLAQVGIRPEVRSA